MKKRYIVLIVILIVLIAGRIYLPVFVKGKINKQLNSLEEYSGKVEGVSLQLFRPGIQLHNLTIFRDVSNDPDSPFIDFDYADITVAWGPLFDGEIVAQMVIDSLEIDFTLREKKLAEAADTLTLEAQLTELIPFRVDMFKITNATIAYKDITVDPPIDIYLSEFFLEAKNIKNMKAYDDTLPSSIYIESQVMHTGYVLLRADFNLLKDIPDFEYTLDIEEVDLTKFDPFIEAYANFNLTRGVLNVYSESAAHDGTLIGYVKPIIEELEILPVEKEADASQKSYEAVLEVVSEILENSDTGIIGTRVDFEGRIDDPDVDVWEAVWILLRNAFLESITKGVDHSIDFEQL